MTNSVANRISATIMPDEMEKVKKAIANISAQLPFLIGLNVDERVNLPKISGANKVFTEDAVRALQNNPTLLPAYFDVAEIGKDLSLYQSLDEIILLVSQLYEKLTDTQMLAGSEAYASALTAYRLFEAASSAGVAGADTVYDGLKTRFAGQGGTGAAAPAADNATA